LAVRSRSREQIKRLDLEPASASEERKPLRLPELAIYGKNSASDARRFGPYGEASQAGLLGWKGERPEISQGEGVTRASLKGTMLPNKHRRRNSVTRQKSRRRQRRKRKRSSSLPRPIDLKKRPVTDIYKKKKTKAACGPATDDKRIRLRKERTRWRPSPQSKKALRSSPYSLRPPANGKARFHKRKPHDGRHESQPTLPRSGRAQGKSSTVQGRRAMTK